MHMCLCILTGLTPPRQHPPAQTKNRFSWKGSLLLDQRWPHDIISSMCNADALQCAGHPILGSPPGDGFCTREKGSKMSTQYVETRRASSLGVCMAEPPSLISGKMGGKQKASQQRNRIHTEQRSFTSFYGKRPFEALRCREAGRVFGQWNPASSKTRPLGGSLRPQWTNWTRVVGTYGHIHWTSKFSGRRGRVGGKKQFFQYFIMRCTDNMDYCIYDYIDLLDRVHSLDDIHCVYWLITFITLITFTTLPSQQITLISVVLLTTFIIYIRYLSCH